MLITPLGFINFNGSGHLHASFISYHLSVTSSSDGAIVASNLSGQELKRQGSAGQNTEGQDNWQCDGDCPIPVAYHNHTEYLEDETIDISGPFENVCADIGFNSQTDIIALCASMRNSRAMEIGKIIIDEGNRQLPNQSINRISKRQLRVLYGLPDIEGDSIKTGINLSGFYSNNVNTNIITISTQRKKKNSK